MRFWAQHITGPGEPIVVRLRQLGATTVAIAVAAAALTACTNRVGAAALVGDHRISDNSVGQYVQPGAVPYQSQDQSTGQLSTVIPKVNVLQDLIFVELFQRALEEHGGPATQTELAANAVSPDTIATETQDIVKQGYQPAFVNIEVQAQELETVLSKRVKDDGSGTQLVAAINALDAPIQVSGRYGVWNIKTYSIDSGASDGIPGFLKLTGTATATPAPAG
jgi:hypothetical protein